MKKWRLRLQRFIATIVCNLRLVWITLLLNIVVNIHFSIRAIKVDTELCHWYWGSYSQYNDDYYLTTIQYGQANNGFDTLMTCNFQNCSTVCPGDCNTLNYYGNTDIGNNFTSEYPVCTITFRYLNIIFVFVLSALCCLSLIEIITGIHMLRIMYYRSVDIPRWYFMKNLHLRSIFTSVIFAFRPGFLFRYIFDQTSDELYPTFKHIPEVPFVVEFIFSLLVDTTFFIGAIFWILFNQEEISIFLFIIALLNFLLTTVRLITGKIGIAFLRKPLRESEISLDRRNFDAQKEPFLPPFESNSNSKDYRLENPLTATSEY